MGLHRREEHDASAVAFEVREGLAHQPGRGPDVDGEGPVPLLRSQVLDSTSSAVDGGVDEHVEAAVLGEVDEAVKAVDKTLSGLS